MFTTFLITILIRAQPLIRRLLNRASWLSSQIRWFLCVTGVLSICRLPRWHEVESCCNSASCRLPACQQSVSLFPSTIGSRRIRRLTSSRLNYVYDKIVWHWPKYSSNTVEWLAGSRWPCRVRWHSDAFYQSSARVHDVTACLIGQLAQFTQSARISHEFTSATGPS